MTQTIPQTEGLKHMLKAKYPSLSGRQRRKLRKAIQRLGNPHIRKPVLPLSPNNPTA